MVKDSKQQPPNFIDLRQPKKRSRTRLIQDVLSPHKDNLKLSQYLKIIVSIAVAILLIALLWQVLKPRSPLPRSLQKQISFTTFLPTKLPRNFKLLGTSYAIENNVLTFEVNAPNNQPLLVSEQAEPANFDVNKFNQELIKNKQVKNVQYGTAYFGNQEASQVGSLVSSGTWIFTSEPKQVGNTNDLVVLMQSLRKF